MAHKRFRLRGLTVDRVDLVDKGANQFAEIVLAKRDFSTKQRQKLASKGQAMSGGGFPIANAQDLKNAIRAIGRAKNRAAAMAHIKRRAAALGLTNLLPPQWSGKVAKQQPDMNTLHSPTSLKRKRMMMLLASRKKKVKKEGDSMQPEQLVDKALDLFAEGMIDANVFTDDATGKDVRDMLAPEVIEKLTDVMSAESAIDNSAEEDNMAGEDFGAYELPNEVLDYITELEDTVAELSVAKSADSESSDEGLDEESRIAKALSALPDDVAAILKADREAAVIAKAEADVAKAASEAAIEKAAVEEYIAKAATYAGVVESAETFGPQLRKVAAWDPEIGKALEEILEGTTAKLAKSALFAELGTKAEAAGSDALAKATTIAKALVEAGQEKNIESARGRVWQENPDLYAEYEAERAESR